MARSLLARSVNRSFTQADDQDWLKQAVRDAVLCHFADEATRPKLIRLHK